MSQQQTIPPLLNWLAGQPKDKFPDDGGLPYINRLTQATGILNDQVHPQVGTGAALADGGFLTDHGPKHIDTVIDRASFLLSYPKKLYPQFTPYEIYILILAAHFHDVGNIFGRNEHETRSIEVMDELKDHLGDESVERRAILNIAKAHGGRVNGDKDTIGNLPTEDYVLSKPVRYQALAALLRFADELADDSNRAARYPEKFNIIPEGSKVFHAYAKSLHSVVVDPRRRVIRLIYNIFRDDALRTFGKATDNDTPDQVFLLDEIYERTLKMHFERIYCMRFLQKITQIDTINVTIQVYKDGNSPTTCFEDIGYRLEETGYPDINGKTFYEICPNVKIDGENLCRELK